MPKGRASAWLIAVPLAAVLSVVGLAGCDSGGGEPEGPTVAVLMTDQDSFSPVNVDVHVGDVVQWTNEDTDPHTANADLANPVAGGPNSAFQFPAGLPTGAHYRWQCPNVPVGTIFYYHCCNHGMAGPGNALGAGMSGSITVVG